MPILNKFMAYALTVIGTLVLLIGFSSLILAFKQKMDAGFNLIVMGGLVYALGQQLLLNIRIAKGLERLALANALLARKESHEANFYPPDEFDESQFGLRAYSRAMGNNESGSQATRP